MDNKLTININGIDYDLACTLRVAYTIQGQHNHKSYVDIFQAIGEMTLEEQINILFAAFKCANAEMAKTFNEMQFREYYLDHHNLKELMDQLNAVVRGIMGEPDAPSEEQSSNSKSNDSLGN